MRKTMLLTLCAIALALPLSAGALGPLSPSGEPVAPGAGTEATITVNMMSDGFTFRFDPPVVTAAVGDTIRFVNVDNAQHSATSGLFTETEPVEGAAPSELHLNTFDTGNLLAGGSATVVVGEQGVFAYYCKVAMHRLAAMHGFIVVQ